MNLLIAEAGTKCYKFKEKVIARIADANGTIKEVNTDKIEFVGLCSKLAYLDEVDVPDIKITKKIRKELNDDMDKKEQERIESLIKKYPNKQIVLVRRKCVPEIIKIFGLNKNSRTFLVQSFTKAEDIFTQKKHGVYGYESIIIAVLDKEVR